VDSGYKFRQVNSDLLAYNTVDARGRKTNEVKLISIGTSDYRTIKLYEEMDGKMVDFLIQDGQLLVSTKPDGISEH
jgi:hypothetical protein